MKWNDEDLPALHLLESRILEVWANHAEMTDYAAGRAYDAAFQHYRARLRGREPKPTTLGGLDLDAFNAVRQACEKLLSTGADPVGGIPTGNTDPIPVEKLVEYLRELARSVERHTKLGGTRGYLEFVKRYMP